MIEKLKIYHGKGNKIVTEVDKYKVFDGEIFGFLSMYPTKEQAENGVKKFKESQKPKKIHYRIVDCGFKAFVVYVDEINAANFYTGRAY